ncbi:MAG TPA: SpoIID/LytB domain-containing protein [Thermoanaerobaculia bacterium]|nr:SpoIID/LytB domain-containing protein [Thermoanaerobaculia bacterium]
MKSKLVLVPLSLVLILPPVITAGCAGRRLPPPATRVPAPAPAPVPQPEPPAPAPQPEEPQPEPPTDAQGLVVGPAEPLIIKVGLASDLESLTIPCCEEPLDAAVEGQEISVHGPLRIEPAATGAEKGYYRLQVAALRDERQAQELARRLEQETGQPGEASFDADIDLYRVRVGNYPTREAAERDLRRLGSIGVTGAFVVSSGASVSNPALRVSQGAFVATYPGRWIAVSPASGVSTRVQGKRYRGRILVYLNDRGMLNLINELPVEEYLRGVVPSEMGPELYNQVEALKAQAVAARTYTLRNLGEFAREGYDICATPRCQVYKGMEVEHPLSDRAIAETAGQVLLYQGRLADALYSSTCGGHTEDAPVVFPLKHEPYLEGVPCMEGGVRHLEGDLPHGLGFPAGLTRQLLPPAPGVSAPQALAARLEHLALLAGLPAPRERLASLDRREVQRFVAAAFDLALDARLLLAPEDVAYLVSDPPRDWNEEDRRRAAYLVKSGLLTGPLDQPLAEEEIERMLLALAELLHVVRRDDVAYLSVDERRLTVKGIKEKEERALDLPERLSTFRRHGEQIVSSDLALVTGDRLTLFWQADRLVAALQEVDLDGVAFDRSSPYSNWTRFRTDSQLASQVNARFPGLGFSDLEILSRGESGRVGKIRITGGSGQAMEVEGLAIRWTLDVPDTLFTAKRLAPKGQEPGWLFTGRGFGHGVGMCQVGSYGMAQRGHTYREILTHYYTGIELGRVREKTAAAAAPGGGAVPASPQR